MKIPNCPSGLKRFMSFIGRYVLAKKISYAIERKQYKWLTNIIYTSAKCVDLKNIPSSEYLWLLGKEGVDQDLGSALMGKNFYEIRDLNRRVPKQIASRFFPYWLDDNSYVSSDEAISIQKIKYRDIWCKIFESMHDRPRGILTGNFGYFAERELATAAQMYDIPFIATHKECLKSPGRIEFFKEVYRMRGKFTGRKIIVYNQIERQLQIDSGVVDKAQIEVCGMARLDKLHGIREKNIPILNHRPTLLAFGFSEITGLPRIPRKTGNGLVKFDYITNEHESLSWTNLFHEYYKTLIKIAFDNPTFDIVIKLKSSTRNRLPVVDFLKQHNYPSNLKIHIGGDPFELIRKSNVICGFNTTSILEGIAAGIPCVTPVFGEVKKAQYSKYVVDYGEGVYKVDDSSHMYSTICHLLKSTSNRSKSLSKEHGECLDKWCGNSDGLSGSRLREVLRKECSK